MKKLLSGLCCAALISSGAADFPNSSFECDVEPLWNRMPDQDVMRMPQPVKYTYSSDSVSGKRSLVLKGQPFETSFECTGGFDKENVVFALDMKAAQETRVRVKITLYALTDKKVHFEKTFKVGNSWQKFKLPCKGRWSSIGPVSLLVDPGKGEVLIDNCGFVQAKKAAVQNVTGGVPEKQIRVPAYIPLRKESYFGTGRCEASQWAFRVFPAAAGAEKNVPLSGVMFFPKSKVFFNSGNFALYDGKKKLAASFTPVAAWPKDKSLSALRVDFACDTAKSVKTLSLRFTPGKRIVEKNVGAKNGIFSRNGVVINLKNNNLWEKNGKLGKGTLSGIDYAGRLYTFKVLTDVFEISNSQNVTLLRRGKMVSSDGKSIGLADVRLIFRSARQGVELDIVLANSANLPVLIKELYWQSAVPGSKEQVKMTVYGSKQKKRFTVDTVRKGKLRREHIRNDNYKVQPQITLRGKSGVTLHCFDGAKYFPSELETGKGMVRGALWPASAKVLSLAPGLSLHKKFLISSENIKGNPDLAAVVLPSGKAFADSGIMISVAAHNPEKFPYFEQRLKTGLGKLAPEEIHVRFNYGQFDYGDHPGDGGWANLESFEDYVLFHRALRAEDPELFRLAQEANNHYIYVDTDIRRGLPHVHCSNHVIGGTAFGHAWVPGVLSSYLVTGSPAHYQVARRMLKACLEMSVKDKAIQQGRNFGFFELTLAEGYAVFNDPEIVTRYMKQLRYQVDRYAKNKPTPAEQWMQRTSIPRQNSLFFVNGSGLVPFHCWYGLTAFLKMYELTQDPYILPVLEKEFKNIMSLEMTYRPQLETHWPGLPAEKMFPAIATDYLMGRGAFYYPVLAKYARISGKKEFRDLAVDTLYCGLLAARNAGDLQDVFMAAPLVDLPENFNEEKQIKKIRDLLWNGAAKEVMNGDFSQSLLYRDLVIPKNGIGTPVYPKWALAKPYPRYWHFTEHKQIISSQFMTFRGYYYTLDEKEFGKAAPSLRLDMQNKSFFTGTSLTGAKFRLEPGEYEYAVSIKMLPGSEMRRVGMRVIPFAKAASRIGVALNGKNEMIHDISADKTPAIYNASYKDTGKPGWKRVTFRFRITEPSLGVFRVTYNLLPKVKSGHIYLDDISVKRIGK